MIRCHEDTSFAEINIQKIMEKDFSINDRFFEAMKHLGINWSRLHESTGVNRVTLSKIKNKKVLLNLKLLILFIKKYPQINPDYIILNKPPLVLSKVDKELYCKMEDEEFKRRLSQVRKFGCHINFCGAGLTDTQVLDLIQALFFYRSLTKEESNITEQDFEWILHVPLCRRRTPH